MQLSETIKLYPIKEQLDFVTMTTDVYISTVNRLVSTATSGTALTKYTSKDVNVNLPSALTNQCIRDAKSILKKHYKFCHKAVMKNRSLAKQNSSVRTTAPKLSVLKRPCCYINNQNFKINGRNLEFPVMINNKSKRLSISTRMTNKQNAALLSANLGTMRIVRKGNRIVAQMVYEVTEPSYQTEGTIMGIDLGTKCPAVSYCSDGSVRFFGNGRKSKYLRRHYRYLRKKLQKSKHPEAVQRRDDKEQRIMRDFDHKLSHDIMKTAIEHNVKTIQLEQLSKIRSTTRTSRKNNHSLHTWSFYRLAQYIEYKARLAGIKVEYVNPAYTSQRCPVCGDVHHAKDRTYTCECGFRIHRDILGARNICNSTEYVGDRNIRHTA